MNPIGFGQNDATLTPTAFHCPNQLQHHRFWASNHLSVLTESEIPHQATTTQPIIKLCWFKTQLCKEVIWGKLDSNVNRADAMKLET